MSVHTLSVLYGGVVSHVMQSSTFVSAAHQNVRF